MMIIFKRRDVVGRRQKQINNAQLRRVDPEAVDDLPSGEASLSVVSPVEATLPGVPGGDQILTLLKESC